MTAADLAPSVEHGDPKVAEGGGPAHFRGDIEGLRAIAVLGVLFFHTNVPGFSGGFVGVDVFFVISGYLITSNLQRASDAVGASTFATFYARRARRLLPAATAVILATLAGSALFQSPLTHHDTATGARASALFYSNILFGSQATDYFRAEQAPSVYQQFWSLSLEEQFYFVWPAVFLGLGYLAHRRRRPHLTTGLALAVLALTSLVAASLVVRSDPSEAFFSPLLRAWELLAGALLATSGPRLMARAGTRTRTLMTLAGVVAVGGCLVLYNDETRFPGLTALLPVLGSAAVIGAGIGAARSLPAARWLGSRPLRAVGRYSYSLYLWHWPVLIVISAEYETVLTRWRRGAGVLLVIVVPISIASYHLIENPGRRWRWLAERPSRALVMAALLTSVSVTSSYVFEAATPNGPFHSDRSAPVLQPDDIPVERATDFVPANVVPELTELGDPDAQREGCDSGQTCDVGGTDGRVVIELWGDSHSAMWADALAAVAEQRGWRMRRTSAGACPSFDYGATGTPEVDCAALQDRMLDRLVAEAPPLIVLVNHSVSAFRRDRTEWEAGVRRTFRTLSSSQVVVLSATPHFDEPVAPCLANHVEDTQACEMIDLDQLIQINDRLRAIADDEGAVFIDVTTPICSTQRCPVIAGNVLMYRDESHFTREFAATRVTMLADALSPFGP